MPPELFRNRVVSVGLGVVSRRSGTVVVGTRKPVMAIGISVRRAKLEQFERALGVAPLYKNDEEVLSQIERLVTQVQSLAREARK